LLFADSRLAKWANLSANVSYTYNSSIKGDFPNGTFTLLDRPDEFTGALAIDFPVNKYFQPIGEFRTTKYVGGRTPNSFEQDPMDLLGGFRIFPKRWFGMSFWYRYNINQQDADIFDGDQTFTTTIAGNTTPVTTTVRGVPTGFQTSTDPHGFGAQFFIGRVNERTPPPKLNQYPTINSVDVDRTEYTIVLPCPPGQEPTGECRESNAIQVSTNATDPDGDALVYQYTVTGGRITGSGANVGWDLSGAKPGTYTISVMVDDGCGTCGQPKTREVVVKECQSCRSGPPPCPSISTVSASPDRVKVGETVTFTASVNTPSGATEPSYNWSVSSGEIVSGQGSNVIMVRATNSGDLTATVELGNVAPECPRAGSATALVEQPPISRLIDEYGKELPNKSKQRLDALAIELQNNPGSRGVIIAWGGNTKSATRIAQRRLDFAIKYLTENRGIERSRLTPINAGASSSGEWTQLWFVPAGAEDPTPQPR
jgi:hypothetical protein